MKPCCLILAGLVAVLGGLWYWTHGDNQAVIAEVTKARDAFEQEVQAHKDRIAQLDKDIDAHEADKEKLQEQIKANEQEIAGYVKELAERRVDISQLDSTNAMLDPFRQAFPLITRAARFGILQLYDEKNDVTLDYVALPATSLEVFIDEKAQVDGLNKQLADYQANQQACDGEAALQAQIDALVKSKEAQYKQLTQEASDRYHAMVDKFLAELNKPKLRPPGWKTTLMLGGLCVLSGNLPW